MIRVNQQSGYIILPVVLAVILVGTIAFMMNYEGALGVQAISSDLETEQAYYVAEAGIQHALWQTEAQGCGPYTDLSSQLIGNHSYSTTLTTDLGATTAYTLSVDQDTWIRSDLPTNNYSGDIKLHIRFEGGIIERPMYRYGLSALPADAAILSAKAWFYVNKDHQQGPVDIHRLTKDWAAADTTWESMGANWEEGVLATIPPQPTAGVWVSVNLTSQVQSWVNGEPNYGITLNSTSEGTHGEYASREAAQQPYLEVIVGDPPSSSASLSATGTLANGVSRSIVRNNFNLYQQPLSFGHMQPEAIEGIDAYIWEFWPNSNYANSDETWVATGKNNTTHALFKFDIAAIPWGAIIKDATLSLYHRNGNDPDVPVTAHRLINAWDEAYVTWNNRKDATTWDTPGGDFDQTPISTTNVGPASAMRYEWNLTSLVQGWVNQTYANNGVVLRTLAPGIYGERFDTSDHADTTRRPVLSITYTCECDQACMAPHGSGNILMVVRDEWSMSNGDLAKKALFESWGYAVQLISEWDVEWDFDTKASNNDVVYVSESVDSNAWGMAPKLTATYLGLVNEEGALNDELGIASGSSLPVGKTIALTDTTHYITQPFALGDLPLFNGDMQGLTLSGTLATGLQVLATWDGVAALVVLDSGAELYGGGTAPGRRVVIPVGLDHLGFNWDYVNNNGGLLIQRAIEWAMDKQTLLSNSNLWFSTLDDVSSSGAPGLDAWSEASALLFADPNLSLEPGTTEGTLSLVFDLDNLTKDKDIDIDALHYVGGDITVGTINSVSLQAGDLLLSTSVNEEMQSLNILKVRAEDIFVFRPSVPGVYSEGSFILLIDGSNLHGQNTVGISLIEKDILVGDVSLAKGAFLMATTNSRDVLLFQAKGLGLDSTSGSLGVLIDGLSLNFGSEIRGLDLAEDEVMLGGHVIPAGAILLTLNDDNSLAGDNSIDVFSEDIFYLTVTQTGSNPIANATLLFDGSDVNLDTNQEHIQALTLMGLSSEADLTLPLAHWKLDETSGVIAVDSIGGHDGTLNNGPIWAAGQVDGALSFDGANDAISIPHADSLSPTDTMTFIAWINAASYGTGYQTIISKDDGVSAGSNYWFGTWQQELLFGFYAAGTFHRVVATGLNLQAGTWYQLAASFDNATDSVLLYVDGVEVKSGAITVSPTVLKADIAIGRSAAGEFWHGLLDDVRIYDGVLSGSEIADLYARGSSGGGGTPVPVDDTCSGSYRDEFNAQDFSGSDGTLDWSGTPWSEVGESDGATSGDVQVMVDESNYQLRIRDNDNGGEGVERLLNLSGAIKVTLAFNYRRMSLDNSGDYVELSISSTGTAGPWTVLDQIGTTNDSTYQTYSRDISDYISANTAIRLLSSSSMGGTDTVWFDNILIECKSLTVISIGP